MRLLALAAAMLSGAAAAAEGPRIASINVCTDQLLLAVADPTQILGLSPYARDPARSWAWREAMRHPLLSGNAEDVLVLHPDLVVAGTFTKRTTRELLRRKGFRVEEFDVALSIAQARDQIVRMGRLAGHPERAAAQAADIDAALARTRAAAAGLSYRVLPLARRGWVSGGESLASDLLKASGLANAAGEIGLTLGGFASIEAIIHLKPDLLLVAAESGPVEDQGQAFLHHPTLERLYPPAKRLVIPEYLTVCGGPMLAAALDRLTAEIERIRR